METCIDIDVRPIEVPVLSDGEFTGRVAEVKGKSLYAGQVLKGGNFYLVSVDGGEPMWCPTERLVALFNPNMF